ncbi:2-methylaconitate cis-trans isomerase PrpF family protein [Salinirubrum litoreum]|uniref:2-methylaconitate cis-trans isomerase PrpF family protein n=1 Tax=Salinirubrum litoreum TaxID=1126234 RepID=A0ABD5RGE0_9EURY|nr:PrpF domain-containing protein [Salinirubrum litoreum]
MTETPHQSSLDGRLIRGGTSRGLYLTPGELPDDADRRDEALVDLFGTPDPLQIDGIGGGNSHTSKVMVVAASDRDDADVDYTFGQVGIENAVVDWSGNCGNLTSGVGVFALLSGLVDPTPPETELTLYNTNTETFIDQVVPVADGRPAVHGDYRVDGIPGTGARIDSYFRDPAGAVTDELLPTGDRVETLTVGGDTYDVSIVDVANPNVLLRARDLGLDGTELPADLQDPDLLDRLELIRGAACERLGLVDDRRDAADERAAVPQIALVSEPQSFTTAGGERVEATDLDVTARIVTTQTPHHSYATTGAMCLAAATHLDGTIPAEFARPATGTDVSIGHPKGTITIGVESSAGAGEPTIDRVRVGRTARLLVDGEFYYHRASE